MDNGYALLLQTTIYTQDLTLPTAERRMQNEGKRPPTAMAARGSPCQRRSPLYPAFCTLHSAFCILSSLREAVWYGTAAKLLGLK
jgi:hypothetical protein